MSPDFAERLIPSPTGFSSEVKAKAARTERAWEATTGLLGAASAAGTAAIVVGIAIPPLAPFLGLVAGSSFYLKLRAKWAKEDPARSDFALATEYRPPRLDLMAVIPDGAVPPGAGVPALLHATGASIEATVLCVERAMGASLAVAETTDEAVRAALVERLREVNEHAKRTEMLTASVRAESEKLRDALYLHKDARKDWSGWQVGAGTPFADVLDKRVVGRLIAAGLDERLLAFPLPSMSAEQAVDALLAEPRSGDAIDAEGESGDQLSAPGPEAEYPLTEAALATEAFGASLRDWASEATLRASLEAR